MKKIEKIVDFILKLLDRIIPSIMIFYAIVLINSDFSKNIYSFLVAFFSIFLAVCSMKQKD